MGERRVRKFIPLPVEYSDGLNSACEALMGYRPEERLRVDHFAKGSLDEEHNLSLDVAKGAISGSAAHFTSSHLLIYQHSSPHNLDSFTLSTAHYHLAILPHLLHVHLFGALPPKTTIPAYTSPFSVAFRLHISRLNKIWRTVTHPIWIPL